MGKIFNKNECKLNRKVEKLTFWYILRHIIIHLQKLWLFFLLFNVKIEEIWPWTACKDFLQPRNCSLLQSTAFYVCGNFVGFLKKWTFFLLFIIYLFCVCSKSCLSSISGWRFNTLKDGGRELDGENVSYCAPQTQLLLNPAESTRTWGQGVHAQRTPTYCLYTVRRDVQWWRHVG